MTDIACFGECIMDMFPSETGKAFHEIAAFRPVPGGAPANVAVAASRLNARAAFIGKVGNDPFGRRLADVLSSNGVDTRSVRFDSNARTTLNFHAQPDADTYECFFYRNPGADMLFASGDLDQERLQQIKAFHCGSLSLVAEPNRTATYEAAQIAAIAGALISFDVNYRPTVWQSSDEAVARIMEFLPLTNIVKLNESELALLTGSSNLHKGARTLLKHGPTCVIVTLGPNGSFFMTEKASARAAGFAVQTVDATGCGDAFMAALLAELTGNGNRRDSLDPELLQQALRFANAAGALTATAQGVIPSLPTRIQVTDFISQQGNGHEQN